MLHCLYLLMYKLVLSGLAVGPWLEFLQFGQRDGVQWS